MFSCLDYRIEVAMGIFEVRVLPQPESNNESYLLLGLV